ncbi:MAG: methyltransferase domain-containing protein [Acidobacteria bacterium]|nr:methyltransferase domain-containing protein [Acidobacteriota bacterium]
MMNPAEFDNIAKAENDFWWYRGQRKIMFGLLDRVAANRKFRRVLEAGAGTGHFAQALEQRYGWPMFPLDLGWEGLEYAKRLGVSRLAQGDIQALPYAENAFDAVISMDVIVHLPRGEEDKPLREFHRVLEPGGLLALRASALDVLRSHHSQFAMERQRFTRARLVDAAAAAGFRVLRCTYANSLLMPVALLKFRVIEPLSGAPPQSGVQPVPPWLDRLLYAPLAAEAKLIAGGVDLPLGQSLILLAEK